MAPTDDGIPLLGTRDGDPARIRQRIAEARKLTDPDERAVRLYFLGRGLLDCADDSCADLDCGVDCEDCGISGEAIEVLTEALRLGSPHAACDLGGMFIEAAETSEEMATGIALLHRAANAGLVDAQSLLGKVLTAFPATRELGEEWLRRANTT